MSDHGESRGVREIYKGRVIHLTSETVLLPNGHEIELEIILHPGASAVVPLTERGNVILLRQYRHAVGGYILEVPAGKLNPGEDPALCAERELTEEAGVVAGKLTPLGSTLTTPGFTNEVIHLYLAEDLRPARTAHEQSEVITLLERPLSETLAMIASGEIRDAKSICALFLAERLVRGRAAGESPS